MGTPRIEGRDAGSDLIIVMIEFTLLLHKDPVGLSECHYEERVYSLLMVPFKSHL